MQAIILAGGQGTRLNQLHPDLPKGLVSVAGKPFLQWQIDWLKSSGITSIHLALGWKANAVRNWLKQEPIENVTITTSVEPEALGTAGGLKFAEPYIQTNPFLVLNGDSLLPNLDFSSMKSAHEKHGGVVTIAIAQIHKTGRFGTVEFDNTQRLTAFIEKVDRTTGWVNGGVYAMNHQALKFIEPDRLLSIEQDIFPRLAKDELIYVATCNPPLLDMGTPDGLKAMNTFLR